MNVRFFSWSEKLLAAAHLNRCFYAWAYQAHEHGETAVRGVAHSRGDVPDGVVVFRCDEATGEWALQDVAAHEVVAMEIAEIEFALTHNSRAEFYA